MHCHIKHANVGLALECAKQILAQESMLLNSELKNGHQNILRKASNIDHVEGLYPQAEEDDKKLLIDMLSVIFDSRDYCVKICFSLAYLGAVACFLRRSMVEKIQDDDLRKTVWKFGATLIDKALPKELSRIAVNTFKLDADQWDFVIRKIDDVLLSALNATLPKAQMLSLAL